MSMTAAAALGTGMWGTMFTQVLVDTGVTVTMRGHNTDTISFINEGESPTRLLGTALSECISTTADIAEAMSGHELVVVAVPVKAVRATLDFVRGSLSPDVTLLPLAKGLELGSLKRADEIIARTSGMPSSHIVVLSSPGLSREIADCQPTTTIVATHGVELAKEIAKACHNSYSRPYVPTDVVGMKMADVTKNVMAVATGAAESMGPGTNTRLTPITRGLAEMTQLGTAFGADPATFAGLPGIGDLVMTCSSRLSYNFSPGYRMGTGMGLAEALALSPGIVEDVVSAFPILQVTASVGVDMPATGAVIEAIEGRASTGDMDRMLLAHPQKMSG